MNTFSLIYCETKKQVLAIIFVPLLIVALYLVSLEVFHLEGDLAFGISFIIFLLAIIFVMLWFMNRVVNVAAQVVVTPAAIKITLKKTNLIHRKKEIEIEIGNISSLTEDINNQNNDKKYFTISTRRPAKSILIMQTRKMDDSTIEAFSALLHANIESYNNSLTAPSTSKIKEGSFYDATWAKILTYVVYAIVAAVTIAAFTGADIAWYKWLQVYAFSLSWLIAYHTNRNRRKVSR